jgi:glucose uptake protein GlcU
MNPGWILYLVGGICAAGELQHAPADAQWGLPVGAAVVGLLFFMADHKRPKRRAEMWMGIIVCVAGAVLPLIY